MRYLKGRGKVVSADPIQLTVSSPNVPNLTLVDMPGESACLPLEVWTAHGRQPQTVLSACWSQPGADGSCLMSLCLCPRSTLV